MCRLDVTFIYNTYHYGAYKHRKVQTHSRIENKSLQEGREHFCLSITNVTECITVPVSVSAFNRAALKLILWLHGAAVSLSTDPDQEQQNQPQQIHHTKKKKKERKTEQVKKSSCWAGWSGLICDFSPLLHD